jgi:hypothetical protein
LIRVDRRDLGFSVEAGQIEYLSQTRLQK